MNKKTPENNNGEVVAQEEIEGEISVQFISSSESKNKTKEPEEDTTQLKVTLDKLDNEVAELLTDRIELCKILNIASNSNHEAVLKALKELRDGKAELQHQRNQICSKLGIPNECTLQNIFSEMKMKN